MEHRTWNGLGVETSLLGFGCMRFPTTPDGKIDEERAAAMLEAARAAGVNYFDTAYPYHGGESERFMGRFLQRWPRDSYYLATKMPAWDKVDSLEKAQAIFAEQCEKLCTDHFDFYLMHAMNAERFDRFTRLGIIDWCEQLKAEGKIRFLGFSFHDDYDVFERILTSRKWDFCQIQYNYMDIDTQAGDRGYALAEKLGVPMIVMEPVKGGALAALPADAAAPMTALAPGASLASWALRWVATHPNIKMILSGMSTLEQVEDNVKTFAQLTPLSDVEQAAVAETRAILRRRVRNGCTGCRYCMPCPNGVDIPGNFAAWNHYGIYQNVASAKAKWNFLDEEEKAKNCIGCGKCEAVCPQNLPIRAQLAVVQQEMDALL